MKNNTRSNKRLSTLDLQVLATLAYSAQFEFPLLAGEIYLRLVSPDVLLDLVKDEELSVNKRVELIVQEDSFSKVKREQVVATLKKLLKLKLVLEADEYFTINLWLKDLGSPPKQSMAQWVASRDRAKKQVAILRAECERLIKFAINCSGIKAIGITGSLAAGSPKKQDDIDFIVIAKHGTLWMTRLLSLVFSLLMSKKKIGFLRRSNLKDHWCFNLWLEEDALQLPIFKRTAFDAFEALQINWIYDEADVEQRFYQENLKWMKKHLVGVNLREHSLEKPRTTSGLMATINRLLFRLSSKHLHRKNNIPLDHLKLNQAFLHDGVSHLQYVRRWQRLFGLILAAANN